MFALISTADFPVMRISAGVETPSRLTTTIGIGRPSVEVAMRIRRTRSDRI